MKNHINIQKVLFAFGFIALLGSCKKENMDETIIVIPPTPEALKIEGEWEVYKTESQELILGVVNQELIQTMEWRDMTSPSPEDNTLKFFSNKTFSDFYAGVFVRDGNWDVVSGNEDEFTFSFNAMPWSALQDTYTVKLHCDNTMSVQYRVEPPAGNHDFQNAEWYVVVYFRRPGTTPCDNLIDYYVE
jgi:hypothetical protein